MQCSQLQYSTVHGCVLVHKINSPAEAVRTKNIIPLEIAVMKVGSERGREDRLEGKVITILTLEGSPGLEHNSQVLADPLDLPSAALQTYHHSKASCRHFTLSDPL